MTSSDQAPSDEPVLGELRAVRQRADAAPPAVVDAAVEAFRWRGVAEAVASVEFDSLIDDDRLARVRDANGERRLRFVVPGRAIEVAVIDNDGGVAGRVEPPLAGTMVLRQANGPTVSAPLDENGSFFFDSVVRGPVSLRPVPTDSTEQSFGTEWVTI